MYTNLITVAQLQELINEPSLVVVDCRFSLADKEQGRRDYHEAHIPGAHYAHLDDDLSGEIVAGFTGRHPLPTIEKAETLFASMGIDADKQVVVYDQFHGGIAARLWWMLRWLGHDAVAVLEGGWKAWKTSGIPTASEVTQTVPTSFRAQPNASLIRDANTLLENLASAKFRVVDSRAAERYAGVEEPIDPVAGHIPGAISAPFIENVDTEGQFLPKDILRKRFENLMDGRSEKEMIFYCGSGVTACHNLLAMDVAGLGSALLYPGSWSDWITDDTRPIATGY